MGARPAPDGGSRLSTYVLDTTVLIAYLRDLPPMTAVLQRLLADGHTLATTCVNLAEIERGLRPRERKRTQSLLDRLRFLETDREGARRAGGYQAQWAGRGRTIHTPDALVAGTARAHGAVVLTHNTDDFPMGDLRVVHPDEVDV